MFDDTHPDWLVKSSPWSLGTALYLIPAKPGGDDMMGSHALNVTYVECRMIGGNRLADVMKWVPHDIMSFADIVKHTGACGDPCVGTCVEAGCLCNRRKKICERAT